MVGYLLTAPEIDVNAADIYGYTALHWACAKDFDQVVMYLLGSHEIDVNHKDADGLTPLLVACTYGSHKSAIKLLESGANYEERDYDGSNVFHSCCESTNSMPILKALLEKMRADRKDITEFLEMADDDGNTPLHEAANNTRNPHARFFIEAGANVQALGQNDRTPLHFAARRGNKRLCTMLIRSGALLEAVDRDQRTPLSLACQFEMTLDLVMFLVERHNANVESLDKDNFTPVMFAAWKGLTETVSYLASRGANLNWSDAGGKTALHYAVEENKVETVKLLLSVTPRFLGIKDNLNNRLEVDILSILTRNQIPNLFTLGPNELLFDHTEFGVEYGETEVSSMAVQVAIPLNPTKSRFAFSQHLSAYNRWGITFLGKIQVAIGALGETKLTINLPGAGTYDPAGKTGDEHATERVSADCIGCLLGYTCALIRAAALGAIESDLEKFRDANRQCMARYHGRLILWRYMYYQVVSVFYQKREPMPYPDFVLAFTPDNSDPRIQVADDERLDLQRPGQEHSKEFLSQWAQAKAGAIDVLALQPPAQFYAFSRKKGETLTETDASDIRGNTPLHIACERGNLTVVAMLLRRCPDEALLWTNDSDQTPLHVAAENGNEQIVEVLVQWSQKNATVSPEHDNESTDEEADKVAIIETLDDESRTPLHCAARKGHKRTIQMLLKYQARLGATDLQQMTPLHLACLEGRLSAVVTLIESDAKLGLTNKKGRTPLHLAAMNNHAEVVELLITKYKADIAQVDKDGRNCVDLAIDNQATEAVKRMLTVEDPSTFFAFMRNYCERDRQTVMDRMIAKMPEAASIALGRCLTVVGDDQDYTITYNYSLLDQGKPPPKDHDSSTALELMVKHRREEILHHPVTLQLISYKWRGFGRFVFYLNLVQYSVFIAALTAFVLITPVPIFTDPSFSQRQSDPTTPVLTFLHAVLTIFTLTRLFMEVIQFMNMRLRYFFDLSNYLELFLYVSTLIIFVPDVAQADNVKPKWKWDLLSIVVFLAWINLMLFARRISGLGIYVLMFQVRIQIPCLAVCEFHRN
eukprot:c17582_g1_i3.p1 GENE.c17582_g1_i3~~c17582_g1_i3.p1  ORF type:complete len:1068 (-),score=285.05 c17582_g1_i3:954-4079(-)